MRITKDIASVVAKKLVDEKRQKNRKLEEELNSEVFEAVKAKISKKAIELFALEKGFFRTAKTARLIGSGFNHESIYFDEALPCKEYQHIYEPSLHEGKKWRKTWDKIQSENIEINKMEKDIEIALYNLKTYNAVSENFPEAFSFLPKKTTTAISINLQEIRNRLK